MPPNVAGGFARPGSIGFGKTGLVTEPQLLGDRLQRYVGVFQIKGGEAFTNFVAQFSENRAVVETGTLPSMVWEV